MSANLAIKIQSLNELLSSKSDLENQYENKEHIFEIQENNEVLGFIGLVELKTFLKDIQEDDASSFKIRNIDASDWTMIFEHPFFQRRKPQLVAMDSLVDADSDLEFFILINGQKVGPYEKYEVQEKCDDKEILITDLVSTNGGHTWTKLYQIDGFERRTLKESMVLPGLPDRSILNPEDSEDEISSKIGETTDAMTSLAYLGNAKKGKILERIHDDGLKDSMKNKANASSFYKWMLIFSVIGIAYFAYNIKNHLKSAFDSEVSTALGEKAELLTPVDPTEIMQKSNRSFHSNDATVNNQGRNAKFETRQMRPITPNANKSFTESNKFREFASSQNIEATNGEENSYFYDNSAPMELDPIRSQISKENYEEARQNNDPTVGTSDN